jgi:hypothetical protein
MSGEGQISDLHRAIVTAAVKAALGERAVVRRIEELPEAPSAVEHVVALHHGIRIFWRSWTGRRTNGGATADETAD